MKMSQIRNHTAYLTQEYTERREEKQREWEGGREKEKEEGGGGGGGEERERYLVSDGLLEFDLLHLSMGNYD